MEKDFVMEKGLEAVLNLIEEAGNDQEFVKEYLREAGYKPEQLLEDAKQLLRKKEIELQMQNGELLQKKFEKELGEFTNKTKIGEFNNGYAMAAKKMEDITGEDEKIIKVNKELLKRMKQGDKSKGNKESGEKVTE